MLNLPDSTWNVNVIYITNTFMFTLQVIGVLCSRSSSYKYVGYNPNLMESCSKQLAMGRTTFIFNVKKWGHSNSWRMHLEIILFSPNRNTRRKGKIYKCIPNEPVSSQAHEESIKNSRVTRDIFNLNKYLNVSEKQVAYYCTPSEKFNNINY